MSLASVTARGGGVTLLFQGVRFLTQVASLIILSRLLSPRDIGLLAMVLAIVGLGDVIRELGLSQAAIQARTINQAQKSNLFWINTGVGAGLTLLCIALAQPIANFYGAPELVGITIGISAMFFINGLQTQFEAELGRSFRFVILNLSEVLALVFGATAAITAALLGAGYWALVLQPIVQAVTLATIRIAAAKWWPSWWTRKAGVGPMLRYGSNLVLTQTLVYLSANVANIIIGARLGAGALGIYSRSYQLLMMPLNQLFAPMTKVALPTLSRLQDDNARFSSYILRAQIILGYGAVGIFSCAVAAALPLIRLFLGEQWVQVAPIFSILAIGGCFQAISYVAYWIFLARGLTGSHFRYSLISRSVLIGAVLFGSIWGIEGIAIGYTIGLAIGWPLSIWWLNRATDIPAAGLLAGGIRIYGLAALSAAGGYAVQLATAQWGDLISASSAIAATVVLMAALAWAFPWNRRDMRQIMATIPHLRGRNA